MRNVIGREGLDKPFMGAFAHMKQAASSLKAVDPDRKPAFGKSLDEVLDASDLHDGMTVSFHHHLRNGDHVLDMVMRKLQERGIRDIKVVASSIFPCHKCLVDMFEDGTVTKVYASYYNGPVAKAISEGKCRDICVVSTHGGRPRMLLEGELVLDIAFIASPSVDRDGNVSGSGGPSACGVLGYAIADAQTAKKVIAITDNITDNLIKMEIGHAFIDEVVVVDKIGDPRGIVSGSTMVTKDPVGLKIARDCATLIGHSGLLKDGFSFQTGAGGVSLAVALEVKKLMKRDKIMGSFASGGITDYLVDMLKEGFLTKLYDVQCFNLAAVDSIAVNPDHVKMDANTYANINNPDNIVNKLDVVILGASEIDTDYNVNVTTGSDGIILGGSGGHADTAAGAKLAIIVSQLVNSRMSVLVDRVTTVTTPGETIDILVTDRGIAIHPRHQELIERLKKETTLEIHTIEELKAIAERLTGIPAKRAISDRIVAISEYRDGTVLDVLYQV